MRSMTGYGKGVAEINGNKLTIEIKSVNHKSLDINIKLPRNLLFLDDLIRKQIQKKIARGHLDIFVNFEQSETEKGLYHPNIELAQSWVDSVGKLAVTFPHIQNNISLETLVKVPDIITREENEYDEELIKLCQISLNDSLESLILMRENEGNLLKEDIKHKSQDLENLRLAIEKLAPTVVETYKNKLNERITKAVLPNVVDQNLLVTEIALYADKIAIDEELTRLKIHIQHLNQYLDVAQPIGREIEFLVQELNRETNTIGAKAQCIDITNIVLNIKNIIEKIREQAANIE